MTKQPIILIHGLFGSLSDPRILGAFQGSQVHAPDLIGYGENRDADTSGLILEDQAHHIAHFIETLGTQKVHLVGHSVGGAVAVLVAKLYPHLVEALVSVEGNFTLKDAFWSGQIAKKTDDEVAAIIAEYAEDPDAWMASAGVETTSWTSALGRDWLANQPPSTIRAQAHAVVEATDRQDYLDTIRTLMRSDIPFCLIAGARSAEGWDVPQWANNACNMRINIANTGHLMMAEDPTGFAEAVLACL